MSLIITSKELKEYKYNENFSKLSSKLKNCKVKYFVDFENNYLDLLYNYFESIKNLLDNLKVNFNSIEYFMHIFNSNDFNIKNNTIKFIETLKDKEIDNLFKISNHLDIKVLTEELIRKIIDNKIKCKEIQIDNLNSDIINLDNQIEEINKMIKEFNEENKITDIYESSDEEKEIKRIKMNQIDEEMNNLKKDCIKIHYHLMKHFKEKNDLLESKINKFNELKEEKNAELLNIYDELKLDIDNFVNESNNKFFKDNIKLCNECMSTWYLSELENDYKKINNIECSYCLDECGFLSNLNEDLIICLHMNGFDNEDSEYDSDEYLKDFKTIFSNVNDSFENFDLNKECISCCLDKELIQCGNVNYIFKDDLNYMFCRKKFCKNHIGDKKLNCCASNCNKFITYCDDCRVDKDKFRYRIDVWDCDNSLCCYCDDFICKEHMLGRSCKDCIWKESR